MSAPPSLSAEESLVLKTLDSMSRTRKEYPRGGEVMKMVGLERPDFAKLIVDLSNKGLVQVSGPITEDRVDFAIVSIHPANREFVRAL